MKARPGMTEYVVALQAVAIAYLLYRQKVIKEMLELHRGSQTIEQNLFKMIRKHSTRLGKLERGPQ